MIKLKIKAGALQLTLFISIVIALLLGAFILYIQLQDKVEKQHYFVQETINNAQKGIEYGLRNKLPVNDSISLLGDDDKSIKVKSSYWGMFTKVTSEATIKKFKFKKVAFIGVKKDSEKKTALHLVDFNKPLVLVGNTNIQGNVFLPAQGVKAGYIAGVPFYGTQLIKGEISIGNQLPQFSSEKKNYLKDIFTIPKTDSDFIDLNTRREWQNSFNEKTKAVYSNSVIHLERINLKGNIKIQSATKIIIDPSAKLTDVLIIAPIIEIKDNVVGSFQAVASEELIVNEGVILEYPSALVLTESDKEGVESLMKISKGCHIKGVLVYLGTDVFNNNKTQLFLDHGSEVTGEVYCNKNIELQGSVYGSVFVANFIAKQSGSIYLNHIYNGSILIDELSNEYVGLSFAKNSNKSILKWMY